MKVNSINVNFGKRLIANCNVKNTDREKHTASLYEYDPWDIEDIKEVESSMFTGAIGYDFYKAGLWHTHKGSRFYVLKDDQTGEITSCCELTHHKRGNSNDNADYLQINEIQGNKRYIDSLTPLMSFISNLGQFHNADSIVTTENAIDYDEISNYYFKEMRQGVYIMPRRRFEDNVVKGEIRNQLDYSI